MKNGEITIAQFNAKLIEMSNETGGFAEQALTATGGIETALKNLGTAVTRGVTEIIMSIDQMLMNMGLGGIEGVINSIKSNISNFLGNVATMVKIVGNALAPVIKTVMGAFQKIGNWITENWETIMIAAAGVVGFFAVKMLIAAAATIAANLPLFAMIGIALLIAKGLQSLGVTFEDVFGFVGGLIGTLVAFFYNRFVDIWNLLYYRIFF